MGNKTYYNQITASVEEFDSIAISLYPNPASSVLHIDLQDVFTNDILIRYVRDQWKKIKSIASQGPSELWIDRTVVPKGMYFTKLNYKDFSAKSFVYRITKTN